MCLHALVRCSCFSETPTVGTCVFMTNKNYHTSLLVHQTGAWLGGGGSHFFTTQWPEWTSTGHFVLKVNIRTRTKRDECDETGSTASGWLKWCCKELRFLSSAVKGNYRDQAIDQTTDQWKKYFPGAGSVFSFTTAVRSWYYQGLQQRASIRCLWAPSCWKRSSL